VKTQGYCYRTIPKWQNHPSFESDHSAFSILATTIEGLTLVAEQILKSVGSVIEFLSRSSRLM